VPVRSRVHDVDSTDVCLYLFENSIRVQLCIVAELLAVFLIVIPDGYLIPAQNPAGMGTGMNFYPWVWV
jgi:hypothetical protein